MKNGLRVLYYAIALMFLALFSFEGWFMTTTEGAHSKNVVMLLPLVFGLLAIPMVWVALRARKKDVYLWETNGAIFLTCVPSVLALLGSLPLFPQIMVLPLSLLNELTLKGTAFDCTTPIALPIVLKVSFFALLPLGIIVQGILVYIQLEKEERTPLFVIFLTLWRVVLHWLVCFVGIFLLIPTAILWLFSWIIGKMYNSYAESSRQQAEEYRIRADRCISTKRATEFDEKANAAASQACNSANAGCLMGIFGFLFGLLAKLLFKCVMYPLFRATRENKEEEDD